MADIVVMPKLGLLMETAMIGAWRLAEGDPVSIGDVIAEITTEKITYELEAQSEGILLKIILPEGKEAKVGSPIAVIGRQGENIFASLSGAGVSSGPAARLSVQAGAEAPAHGTQAVAASVPVRGERIVASPAARKLAAGLGLDLAAVAGSGPGGRITLEDVDAAAAASSAAHKTPGAAAENGVAPAGVRVFATPLAKRMAAELGVDLARTSGSGRSGRIRSDDVAAAARAAAAAPKAPPVAPLSAGAVDIRGGVVQEIPYAGIRRLIGEHMDASRRLAPMVTYHALADVGEIRGMLTRINAGRTGNNKIKTTSVLVKAVCLTLEKMPGFNATLDGDVIRVWASINIGIAVALPDGLIVPVIKEANRKPLSQIAREVRDLAGRAREKKLLPDEVSGGTFTVTSLVPYRSVDFFNPIINQPEVAILGIGRMQDTVVAVDGSPAVRTTMGLSLTCDHRVIDGAPAAEFLGVLMGYLADPFSVFSIAV